MLEVNTTSRMPTHFLAGVELIKEARKTFNVCSENWPYPTIHSLGQPDVDRYYAEVWIDGMDWQNSYWIIETIHYNSPVCIPLVIFENNDEEKKFNRYDFGKLVDAALWYRRDIVWIQKDGTGVYNDLIWPYLHIIDEKETISTMRKFEFRHASQIAVRFEMNILCVPDYKWNKLEETMEKNEQIDKA